MRIRFPLYTLFLHRQFLTPSLAREKKQLAMSARWGQNVFATCADTASDAP